MKIFVTGGAGFIGNYLTTHLVREHQVTIYDDLSNSNKERASELTKLGVNFIQGDVLDYNLLVKSSKNC
jgi:nucleoside-diphosphate-sugar epimerase